MHQSCVLLISGANQHQRYMAPEVVGESLKSINGSGLRDTGTTTGAKNGVVLETVSNCSCNAKALPVRLLVYRL